MKKILYTALAILALASCNKNDESLGKSNYPADGIIRVATSIEGLKSRAGATTDNLAQMGLCVTNNVNSNYSYTNVEMTKSAGAWSSASMMLWQNASQAVDIAAYSPYQSGASYTTGTTNVIANVQADQSATDESGIIASDFLATRKTGFIPGTDLVDGKINLSMSHVMSKLNITITLGTEFNIAGTATSPISEVKINSVKVKGNFNFTTMNMSLANTDNNPTTVIPFAGAYTAGEADTKSAVGTFECIFVPQVIAANDFIVSFKIGGKPYEWTSPSAVILGGGMQYNLKLSVGKDFVSMGSINSSEWGNGTGSDLETE